MSTIKSYLNTWFEVSPWSYRIAFFALGYSIVSSFVAQEVYHGQIISNFRQKISRATLVIQSILFHVRLCSNRPSCESNQKIILKKGRAISNLLPFFFFLYSVIYGLVRRDIRSAPPRNLFCGSFYCLDKWHSSELPKPLSELLYTQYNPTARTVSFIQIVKYLVLLLSTITLSSVKTRRRQYRVY